MVAQFFGLKLRLLANLLRRSPWQVVGIIVGLLYGFGVAFWAIIGLFALRLVDVSLAADVVAAGGSLIVLGFLVVPLVFGVDDMLDPRKFSLYGIPTTRLAVGLALSALVGVPALVITTLALAQIATWSRGPLPVLFAVLAAALIVATCLLGSRVTTSVAAFLLATRRARDATGLISLLILVMISPVAVILTSVDFEDGLTVFHSTAMILGWTPLGAAWTAPADAAAGQLGFAVLKVLIAGAFLGALWLAWRALVGWMLTALEREPVTRSYAGLGWFRRMPETPAGAVAARSTTYWVRDARYRFALLIVPIVPVVMIIILMVGGVPGSILALLPVPTMCFFLAWSTVHNDVAYDSTAIWLHVASNVSGRADRLGRIVPPLAVGVVVIAVGSPLCAWLAGDWMLLPSLIGVSACVLLSGLGLSSIMSARFPYPTVRPGDSPFAQPQSTATAASWIQSLTVLAILVVSAPAVLLAALGIVSDPDWHYAALTIGILVGGIVLGLGIVLGGRIFEARGPELLAFTLRN